MRINKEKKMFQLYERNRSMSKKLEHAERNQSSLMCNYGMKINEKLSKKDNCEDQIKKLERYEMALLDKLKLTQRKQQNEYRNLENIVQDGYGYYLKSFIEKRDKHDSLYPATKMNAAATSKSNKNERGRNF